MSSAAILLGALRVNIYCLFTVDASVINDDKWTEVNGKSVFVYLCDAMAFSVSMCHKIHFTQSLILKERHCPVVVRALGYDAEGPGFESENA